MQYLIRSVNVSRDIIGTSQLTGDERLFYHAHLIEEGLLHGPVSVSKAAIVTLALGPEPACNRRIRRDDQTVS